MVTLQEYFLSPKLQQYLGVYVYGYKETLPLHIMFAYIKTLITGNARITTTLTLSWFTPSLKKNGGILPQNTHDCFIS